MELRAHFHDFIRIHINVFIRVRIKDVVTDVLAGSVRVISPRLLTTWSMWSQRAKPAGSSDFGLQAGNREDEVDQFPVATKVSA